MAIGDTAYTDLTNVRKLVRLRICLEELAAREAAGISPGNPQVRAYLQTRLRALAEAARLGDHATFAAADKRLHEAIVEAARIPLLKDSWELAWAALAAFHRESLRVHWPDLRLMIEEHELLVNAICSGDAMAAADAVRSHLEAVWYSVDAAHARAGDGEDALRRAVAYLQFHLHRPVHLQQVAGQVAFVSAGHLSRLFRGRYGKSFQAYLQMLRLTKAQSLLDTTSLAVAQVARRTGYNDVSRFGQHFKRQFGVTPTRWRHLARHAHLDDTGVQSAVVGGDVRGRAAGAGTESARSKKRATPSRPV